MFFYILFVAILNLALGYALAWYLHGLDAAAGWSWRELLNRSQAASPDWVAPASELPALASSSTAAVAVPLVSPVNEFPADSNAATASRAAEATPEPPSVIVAAPVVEQRFANATRELATVAASGELTSLAVAKPQAEDSAAAAVAPDLETQRIEQAVADLRAELAQYRTEISALDAELHDCASSPDKTTLRSCVEKFREANDQYLEHRDARRERLEESADGNNAAQLTQELAQAVDRQDALVASTQADLAQLDWEADLAAQCVQLLSETQQITACASHLDATLGDTLAEIVRPPAATASPAAAGRPHMHDQLRDLWKNLWPADSAESQPRHAGIGLVNPDQLGRLNAQFSTAVVDRALDELQRVIGATLQREQKAVPAGERGYLLLLPGLAAREALAVVERCRQLMDTTWFEHDGTRFRLTISCALTEAQQADDAAATAERLEALLHEAKRYGRNRTFIHDGAHAAPAVLPSLALEPRTIIV